MSDARLEMLEEENAVLRERIAYLEREFMGDDILFPTHWMLTGDEKRVLGVLLRHPIARKQMIMTALYRDQNRDEAELKIVDVRICKIRQKLRPFEIHIRTIWGEGFAIDEPLRSDIRRQVDPTFKSPSRSAEVN